MGSPSLSRLFHPLTRGRAAVFMMHRFPEPARPWEHDPAVLASDLEHLRRHGYELLSVQELLNRLVNHPDRLYKTLAFTVDDGYADFHDVAAPIFREFDCPVTVFLTTGFLDGLQWLWWDRIRFMLEHTTLSRLRVNIAGQEHVWHWTTPVDRERAIERLTASCVTIPEAERPSVLSHIADVLEIDLPTTPPPQYAPLTWQQVRTLERRGVSFAPHTVTHPILARSTDRASEREIRDSWMRLKEETNDALPVFCYPNGKYADFSSREIAILQQLGLHAAVSAEDGYVTPNMMRDDSTRFALPRFSYPINRWGVTQITSGMMVARQRLTLFGKKSK